MAEVIINMQRLLLLLRHIALAKYNEHTEPILKLSDQITLNTVKIMHSIKYQYAPHFSNETGKQQI